MDVAPVDQPITEWSEGTVLAWLAAIGFAQYEQEIKEHKIDGDVLCRLDLEFLKEIGISSIGQRVAILKAVFQVKLAHNEPIQPGDYIPPSEIDEQEDITIHRLHTLVKEQGDRLRHVEQENRRLQERLHVCIDEISSVQTRRSEEDRGLRKQPSMKWAPLGRAGHSPTKPVPDGVVNESPHASPSRAEHDVSSHSLKPDRDHSYTDRPNGPIRTPSSNTIASPGGSGLNSRASPANSRAEMANGGLTTGSFKVGLDDPTWRVLPAALKKYKIKDEDWKNYAMFICYGNTERCLSYDEKPLLLFQRLKDAKKNPVFMLKHIRDIRSPIAQAQQKQQARLNARLESAKQDNAAGASGTAPRPPVNSHPPVRSMSLRYINGATSTTNSTAVAGHTQWPETMSPTPDNRGDLTGPGMSKSKQGEEIADADLKISYAVAIYPYLAEQDDEFDVTVGDTFVILYRAKGWWVVQRDGAGNGAVELDILKQKWVPAGCLLETHHPVSSDDPHLPPSKVPITTSNIVSTSYPGLALMEYIPRGDGELELFSDDQVRVFKRYNHWSYVVKEISGERGWVPSWFIGKISTSATPQTPNTSHPILTTSSGVDAMNGNNQVSPLSNAFAFTGRSAPGM